jgi:hypothetical protein
MADDQEFARQVRGELEGLTTGAPPVGFTAADVLVTGRARRRSRRLGMAASGGSVAASLAAAVAVLLASVSAGGAGVVPAASPPSGGTAPPASTTTAPPESRPLTPFGLSRTEAATLVKECVLTYTKGGRAAVPPASPAATTDKTRTGSVVIDQSAALATATVYNAWRDDDGMVVLLYGANLAMVCTLDARRQVLTSDVTWQWAVPKLMTGAVTIDVQEAHVKPKDRTGADFDVIAGRVGKQVAVVQVDLNGHAADVTPTNGTYVFRVPRTYGEYRGQPPAWVRAVDPRGQTLGAVSSMTYECLLADGIASGSTPRNCRPDRAWGF